MKLNGEICDHDPGLMITYTAFRYWACCAFCDLQHRVGWRWDKRWRGTRTQGPKLVVAREQLTCRWLRQP